MSRKVAVTNPWDSVKGLVIRLLAEATTLESGRVQESVEIPPDATLGDLAATVAFQLAKQLKKNPSTIAADIAIKMAEQIKSEPVLLRIESKGPYVNVFLNRGQFAKCTVEAANALGQRYGRTGAYTGKRALIEFPAVNPSKPWHIGHARNAVIGDTLGNILAAAGYDVVKLDYINDLGLQIAELCWRMMQRPLPEEQPNMKYDQYLGRLYVEVQKSFETDEQAEKQIREVARQLEDLNSEAANTSAVMVTKCLLAQCQTAYRLGIYHQYQVWESMIAHSGLLELARDLMLKCDNVVKLEEGDKAGCIVVRLDTIEEFKDMQEPYKVLFRSDGTRTYTGADVALQMWKFGIIQDPFRYQVFDHQPNGKDVLRTSLKGRKSRIEKFDVVFNVIGSEQAQPQRLIYTILNLLGYKNESENSHHIAYAFVDVEGTDLSGRKGTWIGYSCDEVLDKAAEIAKEEVAKRNPEENDEFKDKVAAQVGTGAVRYMLLKASPDRKITFRWSEALDFDGDAAPYLQYSYARAQRILEKAGEAGSAPADLTLLSSEVEFALVKAIAMFPQEVLEVVMGLKKSTWGTSFDCNRLTSYCYGLANIFSRFYDSCPVLKADPAVAASRLELVKAFRTTMANCLEVLGIPVVERM
jgi:arginyl-tRNA synthetase